MSSVGPRHSWQRVVGWTVVGSGWWGGGLLFLGVVTYVGGLLFVGGGCLLQGLAFVCGAWVLFVGAGCHFVRGLGVGSLLGVVSLGSLLGL